MSASDSQPSARGAHWRPAFTPESWAALVREFEQAARAYCAGGAGRIFQRDVERLLRVGHTTASRLLEAGVQAGWLVPRSDKTGYGVVGVVTAADTLADLLAFAQRHRVAATSAAKGKQRADGPRDVHGLTDSQLVKVGTAAAFVAERITGDRRRLGAVGAGHFTWRENGGVAAVGAWSLVLQVREWGAELGVATREAHVAAIRNLLDLCATHGRLTRSARPVVRLDVDAAEWAAWVGNTVEELASNAAPTTQYEVETGARVLARFATRRGWLSVERTLWGEVMADVLDARYHATDPLGDRDFRCGRKVYRRLQALGRIDGPEWGRPAGQEPIILVSTGVCVRSARTRNFDAWTTRDGRPATALAYDLTRWATWADKRLSTDELPVLDPPLPARERVDPTPSQQTRAARRRRQRRPEFLLSLIVLERTVQHLAELAGWASDHGAFDPATQGLEVLADPEQFARRCAAWLIEHGRPADGRSAHLATQARALGTIASPFLEREALQRGDAAAAARLRAWGAALQVRAIELEPDEDDRADAQDKVRLWEQDGTAGWPKLERLAQILESIVIEEGGGLTIAEQIAGLRVGTFRPRHPQRWAVAVRDVVMVNLVRRVPLRGENVVGLRIAPRVVEVRRKGRTVQRSVPAHWRVADSDTALWQGPVSLHFDRDEVKQRRAYEAALITPRETGRADAERALRRDVLELYLMAGGARDELLRRPDGSVAVSPYLLPSVARLHRGSRAEREARQYRWSRTGASARFGELLRRHGHRIGINYRQLCTVHGAAGLHVVRHLFGTYFVARGRVKLASLLLGHRTTAITEEVYAGVSTLTISVDAMARDDRHASSGGGSRHSSDSGSDGYDEDRPGAASSATMSTAASAPTDFAGELRDLVRDLREALIDRSTYDAAVAALRMRYGVSASGPATGVAPTPPARHARRVGASR